MRAVGKPAQMLLLLLAPMSIGLIHCLVASGCRHDISDIEPGWGHKDNAPAEAGSDGEPWPIGGSGGEPWPGAGSSGAEPRNEGLYPDQCGNGHLDEGEKCDGDDLAGQDCTSFGYGGGQLKCFSHDCTFDTSGCTREQGWCGNGRIDDTEQCDGPDLGGQDCGSQGFDGGDLTCRPSCQFDFAGCWNGEPDAGEPEGDVWQKCRDEASVPTENRCRDCLCEWCASQILECDETCWGFVGCVMAFCPEDAGGLQGCAVMTPCSQVFAGGETGAMGLLGSGCDTRCLSTCAAVERRCPGDMTVSNGRELATLAGCSIVEGSLWVQNLNLSDLKGLRLLREVQGDLHIASNPSLYDLSGLENLENVGGKLIISYNDQLDNLDALSRLNAIGDGGSDDHVHIHDNPALANMAGLSGISSISGDLYIDNNDALTHLSGLESLGKVGGKLTIANNDALENIDALSQISDVGGDVQIEENDYLESVGLFSLASVQGALYIRYNRHALTDLSGMSGLSSVGKELYIEHNDSLVNLGLGSLEHLGSGGYVNYNSLLPSCQVEQLRNQLGAGFSWPFDYCGNDNSDGCGGC